MHRPWLLAAAVVAVSLVVWRTAAEAPLGLDYPGQSATVNHAGGAIRALVDGDLDRFFASQPPMGSFSLFLRAPFATLAGLGDGLPPPDPRLTGGHQLITVNADPAAVAAELDMYRLGIVPCLGALALFVLFLGRVLGQHGRPLWLQALVAALIMLSPLIDDALALGHPEELLAGALAVGGVLLGLRGHAVAAGTVVGLAVVTKQWALLAVIPALAAAAPRWRPAAAAAVAAIALFTVPMAIGDPGRFFDAAPSLARGNSYVKPQSVWWPVSRHDGISVFDGVAYRVLPRYTLPDAIERLVHPLVAVVGIGLGALYLRLGRGRDPTDLLLLLALVLFLRAILDHLTHPYYFLPFLLALAAWEGLRREGLPVATVLAALLLWPEIAFGPDDYDVVNALHLLWALPATALLAVGVFAPARARGLFERLGLTRPVGPYRGARVS